MAGFDAADGDGPVQNEVECGVTKHRAFNKRIIGGKKAKFAELPWQVRSEWKKMTWTDLLEKYSTYIEDDKTTYVL